MPAAHRKFPLHPIYPLLFIIPTYAILLQRLVRLYVGCRGSNPLLHHPCPSTRAVSRNFSQEETRSHSPQKTRSCYHKYHQHRALHIPLHPWQAQIRPLNRRNCRNSNRWGRFPHPPRTIHVPHLSRPQTARKSHQRCHYRAQHRRHHRARSRGRKTNLHPHRWHNRWSSRHNEPRKCNESSKQSDEPSKSLQLQRNILSE